MSDNAEHQEPTGRQNIGVDRLLEIAANKGEPIQEHEKKPFARFMRRARIRQEDSAGNPIPSPSETIVNWLQAKVEQGKASAYYLDGVKDALKRASHRGHQETLALEDIKRDIVTFFPALSDELRNLGGDKGVAG